MCSRHYVHAPAALAPLHASPSPPSFASIFASSFVSGVACCNFYPVDGVFAPCLVRARAHCASRLGFPAVGQPANDRAAPLWRRRLGAAHPGDWRRGFHRLARGAAAGAQVPALPRGRSGRARLLRQPAQPRVNRGCAPAAAALLHAALQRSPAAVFPWPRVGRPAPLPRPLPSRAREPPRRLAVLFLCQGLHHVGGPRLVRAAAGAHRHGAALCRTDARRQLVRR